MTTTNEQKEAQAHLGKLLAEKTEVEYKIKEAQDALKSLENRLSQLRGGWGGTGEIQMAKLAIRDSAFPILIPKSDWRGALRIISVSPKTITLREDGDKEESVTRYSRETGKPPNSKYHSGIDVEKALAIWEAHAKEAEVTA